jgi:FMN phosphatase YigB (HAD superfamily)
MICTLLLDLDDTLLDNNIDDFLPVYLARLGKFMANVAPPEIFTAQLLRSTRVMMANSDPERTLQEAFNQDFYPALGIDEKEAHSQIERFYTREFPHLQSLTKPRSAAKILVIKALEMGLEVVVATNPLFPRLAIEHRLAWADLAVNRYPFALVTSYETFHFCKPNPAYFAEILGRLGRQPAEAAMVGDDMERDITPAQLLGLRVFYVGPAKVDGIPSGNLQDVLPWMQTLLASDSVSPSSAQPQAILAMLRGNLAALLSITAPLEQETWARCPAPEEWGPLEVVCHLRDVEIEVHQPRIESLLSQDDPFIPAVEPDRWAAERDYHHQSPRESLSAFTRARKETISRLSDLTPEEWRRRASHALLGPTTLGEICSMAAEHDVLHLAQLRDCLRVDNPH